MNNTYIKANVLKYLVLLGLDVKEIIKVKNHCVAKRWFDWIQSDDGTNTDWADYVTSLPEAVMKSANAGYHVSYWMMKLSCKISMSTEAIAGSQQQLDKIKGVN